MDIMIDIETLGTSPGCVVLSVGAVAFDRRSGSISKEFYKKISTESSQAAGLTCDAGTVVWWMSQNDEARSAITSSDSLPLVDVCKYLSQWFADVGRIEGVWAQGADFDFPILKAVFAKAKSPTPWSFWLQRDTRTAYDIRGFDPKSVPRSGDYHNALDDAKHQVACLTKALNSF